MPSVRIITNMLARPICSVRSIRPINNIRTLGRRILLNRIRITLWRKLLFLAVLGESGRSIQWGTDGRHFVFRPSLLILNSMKGIVDVR